MKYTFYSLVIVLILSGLNEDGFLVWFNKKS